MKRTLFWLLAGCLLTLGTIGRAVGANDRDTCPNAAVVYWQAFAAMPTLEGQEKTKYEAAIKTPLAPLADDLKPIVARFGPAFRELHRGCAVSVCDWNLNADAGPETLLPHLGKARDLSRAAILRARLRFAAGETDAALEDVLDVIKLARDCGRSPILISLLVDAAIEKSAFEVLAANLAKLSPSQLDKLTASLKAMPATASMAECLRSEQRMFVDWFERIVDAEAAKGKDGKPGGKLGEVLNQLGVVDEGKQSAAATVKQAQRRRMLQSLTIADMREAMRQLRGDYAHLTRIASLGYAERRARWSEYEAKLAESRKQAKPEDLHQLLAYVLTPALGRVADREEQLHVQRSLMALAIEVQRHGPDAMKAAQVTGTVKYQKTADGFELHGHCEGTDKPEVLHIGSGK